MTVAPKTIKEITAVFGRRGGYFFLLCVSTNSIIATINAPSSNNCSQVMYMGTTSPLREGKRNSRFPIKRSNRHRDSVPPGLPQRETFSILFSQICLVKSVEIKD